MPPTNFYSNIIELQKRERESKNVVVFAYLKSKIKLEDQLELDLILSILK